MTDYEAIQETLATPGAKIILRALRSKYKDHWRMLRKCAPEDVIKIQSQMDAIDALPLTIQYLANAKLDAKRDREKWFSWEAWAKRFRFTK